MVQPSDIVRHRTTIGIVKSVQGQEAHLVSLEGVDCGVVVPCNQLEVIRTGRKVDIEKLSMVQVVQEQREKRETNIKFLRKKKELMKEVMGILREGGEVVEGLEKEVMGK